MPKLGAVIVARMRSSRFPGKSLVEIAGKPSLLHLLERVRLVPEIQDIVIATTDHMADDPLAAFAKSQGIACFRGSEDDVMGRVLQAAQSVGLDEIVHLTGDCPLMDATLIRAVIALFQSKKVDYAKNFQFGDAANPKHSFPRGLEVEVFKTSALADVAAKTTDPWLREHVTEPLYTWPQYAVATLTAPVEFARPDLRLCVDTPEDLALVAAVYQNLQPSDAALSTRAVIAFLDAHPEIKSLNSTVQQTKYRAAVIGLGNIGALFDQNKNSTEILTHAGAYQRWSKTHLVAGCDRSPEKRHGFQDFFGVKAVFDDPEIMLQNMHPDIVSIATPPEMHAEILLLCLKHGVKAVFCEKPFVSDLTSGRLILQKMTEAKMLVAVNHWMRASPLFRAVHQAVHSGFLGEIRDGYYHYSKGIMNSGTHALDLLRFFFGDILAVQAGHACDIANGEKNVDGILEFHNGLLLQLRTSDYLKNNTSALVLEGSSGRLFIGDDSTGFKLRFWRGDTEVPTASLPWKIEKGDYMVEGVANLVDAIEGRAEPYCSAWDGFAAVEAANAFLKSWDEGGKRIILSQEFL